MSRKEHHYERDNGSGNDNGCISKQKLKFCRNYNSDLEKEQKPVY